MIFLLYRSLVAAIAFGLPLFFLTRAIESKPRVRCPRAAHFLLSGLLTSLTLGLIHLAALQWLGERGIIAAGLVFMSHVLSDVVGRPDL